MNELDLKIIDILGECADKEIKPGCIIEIYIRDRTLGAFKSYDTITKMKGKSFVGEGFTYGQKQEDGTFVGGRPRDNIIGQYGLHNILMWLQHLDETVEAVVVDTPQDGSMSVQVVLEFNNDAEGTPMRTTLIYLDITKPPMEWSTKQKQEFIDFAERLNNLLYL